MASTKEKVSKQQQMETGALILNTAIYQQMMDDWTSAESINMQTPSPKYKRKTVGAPSVISLK
eukprot:Awhi_evm1s4248